MGNEIAYMLGVVAVGFAVNYMLRALPFLLFAGRSRDLPPWVERFGNIVSPVIIGGLIVYSYWGLQWKTPWPFLAGVLTVGLQLWKRNPLASIIAGTVLYMVLVNCCGCASRPPVVLDAKEPSIRMTNAGLYCGDERVMVEELADILEANDIPKTRTVHILLEPEVKDLSGAKFVMAYLAKQGYTRPVLVTKRHGESYSTGKKPQRAFAAPVPQRERKIRYKKANE